MSNSSSPGEGSKPIPQTDSTEAIAIDACLEIKTERLQATLIVHRPDRDFSPASFRRGLEKKLTVLKIVFGVDWSLADRILSENLFDRSLVIAKGTPPKEGHSAFFEEVVKREIEAKPRIREDGQTDYKNIDNIRQVTPGELIAIKHPYVAGEHGMDVFGKEILPQPIADRLFRCGPNTILSEDGLNLIAQKGGFLYHSNGDICVGEIFEVKGDVDFNTGNLHYKGDILVHGSVASGFMVEADGNITIEGNVDSAEIISHGGSIKVLKSVFGQGKSRIAAKENIHIVYAQDAQLECGNKLEVEKGLRNCKATAGSIKADKSGCVIFGGQIKSYSDFSVAVLGAEGCRTEITLANQKVEAAELRLPAIETLKKSLQPIVNAMDKKLKDLMKEASKSKGGGTPQLRAQINEALAQYGRAQKTLAPLDGERKGLMEELHANTCRTGKLAITEKIVYGVRLRLYGKVKELDQEDAKKEWIWTPGELEGRSLIPSDPAS